MNKGEEDLHWMREAIAEARHGLGQCSPNPAVGAVIVKDEKLIARGFHRGPGLPHAEREAIAAARTNHPDRLAGSTLYVTLEPCSTHGRTPPCTDAIIEAGIKRCVFAADDPNPVNRHAARAQLEAAGVSVTNGVARADAEALIRGFRSVHTRSRPWVISKIAMSLDGRLSRPPGESQWLSSEASRERVQAIRREVDAILVGANTLRRDNPKLTLRGKDVAQRRQALRILLCRDVTRLPADAHLLTDEFKHRTRVIQQLSPREALRKISGQFGVNTLLLEAGGRLQGAFFDAGLVDEVHFFYAPMLCGGPNVAVGGTGCQTPADGTPLSQIEWQQHGDDLELHALVSPAEPGNREKDRH